MNVEQRRWGGLINLMNYALLAIIVAGGAWLRFGHGDWDGGNQLHPDERAILYVAQDIAMPASLADAFIPAHSPLNPFRTVKGVERAYPYGHLPLYGTVIGEQVLGGACSIIGLLCEDIAAGSLTGRLLNVAGLPRFDHLTAVGRALAALFDTLTIMAVWLLANELCVGECVGRPAVAATANRHTLHQPIINGLRRPHQWAAYVAAGLCAVAVLHIQNAHFGTVDTALALFATLSVWLLVRYSRMPQRRDAVLAGLCTGLALGCKASAVLLAFPIGTACLAISGQGMGHRLRLSSMRDMGLMLAAALLAFGLTNPYALLDPMPFLNSVAAQAAMTSGTLDWPFTRQYIGTLPLAYPIEQQARWGLGLPLTLAAYGGLVWAAWRTFRERSRPLVVAVVWALSVLVGGGAQLVKFPRYLLPLTPTLFALAGRMFTIPWGMAGDGKERRVVGWLRRGCLVVVVVPTIVFALAFEGMYREPHPWVAASEWVYQELPARTHVAAELDDVLPLDIVLDGQLRLRDEHVETCTFDSFAEPDDEARLRRTLECVAGADYLIISSNRTYSVIPRLEGHYPLAAAYYRALFDRQLGFEVTRSFERPPTLLGWSLVDDPFAGSGLTNPLGGWGDQTISLGPADESFTLYDHPLVLVFANNENLPVERMRQRIGNGQADAGLTAVP